MIEFLPKICGAIGLLCITYGIFVKNEVRQDILFIIGGGGLLIYSISLKDPIFITLQIIFILASAYEIGKIKKS